MSTHPSPSDSVYSIALTQLAPLIPQAVIRGQCSAGAIAILENGHHHVTVFGTLAGPECPALHGIKVNQNTLWDIASITKSVVNLLTLYAISGGHLSLSDDVAVFFPRLRVKGSTKLTIMHLLTYACTFNLEDVKSYNLKSSGLIGEALVERVLTSEVEVSLFNYSNYPPILLAKILEQIEGRSLDQIAQTILFGPLGMNNTTFCPSMDQQVVATEIEGGQLIHGVVHDELSRAIGKPSGAAGIFSSATDMLKLCEFLLRGCTIDSRQVIDENLVVMFGKNQFTKGTGFGLGFGIGQEFKNGFRALLARQASLLDGMFFKNGFPGPMVALLPAVKKAVVLLLNHTYPYRKPPAVAGENSWLTILRYCVVVGAVTGELPDEAKQLWI